MHLRFFSLGLACWLFTACRTTETTAVARVQGASTPAALGEPLKLDRDTSQTIYLKMLEVEIGSGLQIPREQLHTSRGTIACRELGILRRCDLVVRLRDDAVSASQPLAAAVSQRVSSYALAQRPELAQENLLLTTITCDYIGKKSPPYHVESVACQVALPRAVEEAVILGQPAADLSEGLRGEAPYGNAVVTLNGAVVCQWLKASARTPCVTRATLGGVLQEKVTELPAGSAAEVAKGLLQAVIDASKISSGKDASAPPEISAILVCTVDNTKVESSGRSYACRARI